VLSRPRECSRGIHIDAFRSEAGDHRILFRRIRAIDALGIDASGAHSGPTAEQISEREIVEREQEVRTLAPDANPRSGNWNPGEP